METKKKNLQKALTILSLLLFIVSIANAKISDIVLKQKKAIVTIYINDKDEKRIATGSGFVVDSNGLIATNYHLISKWLKDLEATLIVKMENGAYFPIEKLLTLDEENDIALFKVEGKELPTVKLATDYKPKQGESIIVIGSPLGLETTVSDGIVSSIRGKSGLIQITAPISPGSSGSPVFNSKGEVVGVATFLIEGGQNLNFAIPVRHVANLLEESKKPKKKIEPAPLSEAPASVPAPTPAPATSAVDPINDNQQSVWIEPGVSIGEIKLGIDVKELISKMGEPLKIEDLKLVSYSIEYPLMTVYLSLIDDLKKAVKSKSKFKADPDKAIVDKIISYDYRAKTRGNLSIGASLRDVLDIFGDIEIRIDKSNDEAKVLQCALIFIYKYPENFPIATRINFTGYVIQLYYMPEGIVFYFKIDKSDSIPKVFAIGVQDKEKCLEMFK